MEVETKRGAISIAIAGNPNSGKTTVFNNFTGTNQSVGNYPGVTVEKKEGKATFGEQEFRIIDLPGTYSLTAYSLEEVVARNFVIEDKPDVLLNILDASNLERNLYLTVQFMEMNAPLVIALNMIDLCDRKGFKVDSAKMSVLMGVPVVPTQGSKNTGMNELLKASMSVASLGRSALSQRINYGHEVETEIMQLTDVLAEDEALCRKYNSRWLAIKLLEKDAVVKSTVHERAVDAEKIFSFADRAIARIEEHFDDSSETIIAERRYGFAAGVVRECVTPTGVRSRDVTDKIDAVVCNRIIGPAILGGVVYLLFLCTFKLADEWQWIFGKSMTGWVDALFEELSHMIAGMQTSWPMLHSLLNDGVISGVGGVIGFVPLIFCMFAFVAILEDTGYIARIAFILDKALKIFGLQGKSILAMIVAGGLGGGGCAVPGVMATRTLKEEKDRLITILVTPFMNCGAKMPVYMMLIAAFFATRKAEMLFALWMLSWFFALTAAFFLRKFVVKGEQTPFVMELPTYHVPTIKGVMLHTGERTWMYMKKAGTIILAINVLIWASMYFPRFSDAQKNQVVEECMQNASLSASDVDNTIDREISYQQLANSFAGRLGRAIEPVSRLAGFEWKTNIALIGGFAAKEVVIGVLGTAYSMGATELGEADSLSMRLAADPAWNPIKAFALMVFVMVYAPCFVTVVVIKRETGSWRWALFATAYTTTFGFLLAVLIYQTGMLFS